MYYVVKRTKTKAKAKKPDRIIPQRVNKSKKKETRAIYVRSGILVLQLLRVLKKKKAPQQLETRGFLC